jgi:hypothetical protein
MEPFHLLVAIISPLKSTIAGDQLIQVLNTQRYLDVESSPETVRAATNLESHLFLYVPIIT